MGDGPKKTSVEIPPDLWKEAKLTAVFMGVTLGDLLTDALRYYLQKRIYEKVPQIPPFKPPRKGRKA